METASESRPSLAQQTADRDVRRARRRFLPFYVVWGLLLPVGLVQVWFAFARRSIAYELPAIESQTRLVRSEIEKYHIEAESLKALHRVAMVAEQLGFARPTTPPVVLPPTVAEVAGEVATKEPLTNESRTTPQEASIFPIPSQAIESRR